MQALEKLIISFLDMIIFIHDFYFQVSNTEVRGKMSYTQGPQTEFQKYIRAAEWGTTTYSHSKSRTYVAAPESLHVN